MCFTQSQIWQIIKGKKALFSKGLRVIDIFINTEGQEQSTSNKDSSRRTVIVENQVQSTSKKDSPQLVLAQQLEQPKIPNGRVTRHKVKLHVSESSNEVRELASKAKEINNLKSSNEKLSKQFEQRLADSTSKLDELKNVLKEKQKLNASLVKEKKQFEKELKATEKDAKSAIEKAEKEKGARVEEIQKLRAELESMRVN